MTIGENGIPNTMSIDHALLELQNGTDASKPNLNSEHQSEGTQDSPGYDNTTDSAQDIGDAQKKAALGTSVATHEIELKATGKNRNVPGRAPTLAVKRGLPTWYTKCKKAQTRNNSWVGMGTLKRSTVSNETPAYCLTSLLGIGNMGPKR